MGLLPSFVLSPGVLAQATTTPGATAPLPVVSDAAAPTSPTETNPLPVISDAQPPSTPAATSPSTVVSDSLAKSPETPDQMLLEAYRSFTKGDLDGALSQANNVIKMDSGITKAYLLRGAVYSQKQDWDKAEYDYEVALLHDPGSAMIKFDQAELKFMQKNYDDARPSFVDLEKDKEFGDFATYKVFLCDLFGAHEDVAAKELDSLNQVGGNPSYYFGNAAWDLVHNKTGDASDWLKSAGRIYANAPDKIAHYTASLTSLGYLPIRSSSAE